MDLTQLTKIERFANWIDRKPRAWLLFVLSAGCLFFAYEYVKKDKQLDQCKIESQERSDKQSDLLYQLIDRQQMINMEKKDTVKEVHTVLQKAKQTIQEVKSKL